MLSILQDDFGIVGTGFDADDLFDLNEFKPSLAGRAILSSWLLGLKGFLKHLISPGFGCRESEAFNRLLKFLDETGFWVIKGTDANGVDGIMIIGSDKNDFEIYLRNLLQQFKSTHPGVWYQKNNVGLKLLDHTDGFLRVLGLGHHFNRGTC